jgi:hypothetical protein
VAVGALVVTVLAFVWVAVKSYDLLHGNQISGASKLQPVEFTGPEELVFSSSRDGCEPRDIADAPARAFRDVSGTVHLIASHYITRQMTGPDLDHVQRRCTPIMRSAYDRRPSMFAFKEWLFAPYTPDGKTVFALIHDEFHGNEIGDECPSGIFDRCWYNAVTLARSDDGGASFHHAQAPPRHLVAAIPYRYVPDAGRTGIFQPSNIVQKGKYYYSLVASTRYRLQKAGDCLIRTDRLDDPGSWRAWNGDDFKTEFADPYRLRDDPADHVCEPVAPDRIADMTMSLTYNTYFGKYLLVGNSSQYIPGKRRVVNGFYYSLSEDLIKWSQRKLIKEVEVPQTYQCGDPDPVYYSSVLDPESKSRNFETTGKRAYIYFTRFHYKACTQTLDRDLMRVPVEFSK